MEVPADVDPFSAQDSAPMFDYSAQPAPSDGSQAIDPNAMNDIMGAGPQDVNPQSMDPFGDMPQDIPAQSAPDADPFSMDDAFGGSVA